MLAHLKKKSSAHPLAPPHLLQDWQHSTTLAGQDWEQGIALAKYIYFCINFIKFL